MYIGCLAYKRQEFEVLDLVTKLLTRKKIAPVFGIFNLRNFRDKIFPTLWQYGTLLFTLSQESQQNGSYTSEGSVEYVDAPFLLL